MIPDAQNPLIQKYLEITYLTKTFPTPKGPSTVVRNFNLALKKGEFVTLIGHSGCGKSTVLSIVAGLTTGTEGGVLIEGREITGPGPDRGVVFQAPCLLPWLTAFDNVLLGVEQAMPNLPRRDQRALVTETLELVGLGDSLTKKPAELSGGMQQRVGIARAFALRPKVLLLDEPFGMLDALTRYELQQVLIDLWSRHQTTALMVTHDVDEALFLSDRVAMMTNGPEARIGGILKVPFPRPRQRTAVIEHPEYYQRREDLITFLEDYAHGASGPRASNDPAAPSHAA
ncbi:MAG: nitrate/nitrite transport system ATP-binding protein [Myxococcales bacterium]|nr:nitrate/nitrite transport system ATP-binding protein [Myxococcales bacterium]